MNKVLAKYMGKVFKTATKTFKSTDTPWITSAIKRQINKRKRMFKKERKRTKEWRKQKRKTDLMIM